MTALEVVAIDAVIWPCMFHVKIGKLLYVIRKVFMKIHSIKLHEIHLWQHTSLSMDWCDSARLVREKHQTHLIGYPSHCNLRSTRIIAGVRTSRRSTSRAGATSRTACTVSTLPATPRTELLDRAFTTTIERKAAAIVGFCTSDDDGEPRAEGNQ